MDQNIWKQLTTYESLLAIGVTLVMGGIILRGFAASNRRDLARRKEHRIDDRKSPEAFLTKELGRPPGWLEKNLGLLANVILVAGVVISAAAFWRS
ncbi:MAG TPA: hypothetical protein VKC51_03190 [Lacunisphaera sp.]|nr:hypothetical protein [Lacunisphaera sp.]